MKQGCMAEMARGGGHQGEGAVGGREAGGDEIAAGGAPAGAVVTAAGGVEAAGEGVTAGGEAAREDDGAGAAGIGAAHGTGVNPVRGQNQCKKSHPIQINR